MVLCTKLYWRISYERCLRRIPNYLYGIFENGEKCRWKLELPCTAIRVRTGVFKYKVRVAAREQGCRKARVEALTKRFAVGLTLQIQWDLVERFSRSFPALWYHG